MAELNSKITFPFDCTTINDKFHYSMYAQEQLRILHNLFGKWHREGITLIEWNSIWLMWEDATELKKLYPHTESELSEELWKKFLDEIFRDKQAKCVRGILENRQLLKASSPWIVKMGDI